MKTPFLNKTELQAIVEQYPTPFHLYDEKGIRENARRLNEAFSWNRGFREYFAVKATPNPEIMRILKEEGCGMDCSSYTELLLSERAGFTDDMIMFSSNVTPAKDYKYAAKLGATINLDDITHIDFLEKTAGIPETICCRYNPGNSFTNSNDIMDSPSDAKYGFTYDQLVEGFRILKARGVKKFGIHSFLASNTLNTVYYPALAKMLFETVVQLEKDTDVRISFINLSGGIGIPYLPDEEGMDIFEISEIIRKHYEKILIESGYGDIDLYTELGRFMLGPYGALVTTALHEKRIHKNYIGVDACAANLMRPAMYGAYHHISVMGKEDAENDHLYDVTGGLCENNDKFAIDRKLPGIDMGDLLFIHDTGAHGFSMGYNYNGKLRSAEVLLRENGEAKLIRRAETPEDYLATLDI